MANIKITNTNQQFDMEAALAAKNGIAPQKSFLWRVQLPDLRSNSVKTGLKFHPNTFDEIFALASEDPVFLSELQNRITNVSIPFSTVMSEKETYGNSYWYYAKQNDIGTITFDMLEFEDQRTLRWLNAWQSLMINPDGTYNPPAVYKQDLMFYRMSADKKDIMTSIYKGYFVTAINDMSNDYETNEIVRYNVTLTGDEVEHNIFSIAGLLEDPDMIDKLANILSVENALDTVDTALSGIISQYGNNIPSLGSFF